MQRHQLQKTVKGSAPIKCHMYMYSQGSGNYTQEYCICNGKYNKNYLTAIFIKNDKRCGLSHTAVISLILVTHSYILYISTSQSASVTITTFF